MEKQVPILIAPVELYPRIDDPNIKIIDISVSSEFRKSRIPGSFRISAGELYDGKKPTPGLVPTKERLQEFMSNLGLTNELQIIAYDDEGGGHASRLVWTLYLLNHRRASVLNGGIQAWLAAGLPTVEKSVATTRSKHLNFKLDDSVIADREYIQERLGDPNLTLLDARTPEEYHGRKVMAKRGGHIPGAINLNWLNSIDTQGDFRLKCKPELDMMLFERNISPANEIVVYCQTHHRSAQSWMMLRHLGFPKVRGYPGSWSEWGNNLNTPIEL